jgi:hypothetical protein
VVLLTEDKNFLLLSCNIIQSVEVLYYAVDDLFRVVSMSILLFYRRCESY